MSVSRFRLTRRAAQDLRDIYRRSRETWGEKTARKYMDDLYVAMGGLQGNDDRARQRQERSFPFRMIPAGKHFIVYDMMEGVAVVITLLHQHRDIEAIIGDFTSEFLSEVSALRQSVEDQS